MKVALVYDRINKWGGAERLLLALHKLFPDAPLYTSVYNKDRANWARVFDPSMGSAGSPQAGSGQGVQTSFLQRIPFANTSHEILAPLMPIAFESFSFDEYDVVISVTSEAAKGIITKPQTLHVCYCLTPTRYLWSGYRDYFPSPLFRLLSKPAVSYLKSWDIVAAQRPDVYVAISKEVQDRIKRYYDREAFILYPPVGIIDDRRWKIEGRDLKIEDRNSIHSLTSTFRNQPSSTFYSQSSSNTYFLIVSRLVPYKRIDIAIHAFNKIRRSLKIIGSGTCEKRLKSIAGPTIEFLGTVTDGELYDYYQNAEALVFPGIEDFGLVMAEAQAFGTPVIAYRRGGALEIVIEGKTGEFFDRQTPQSLIQILEKFDKRRYNRQDCMRNAERFSHIRFEKEFREFLNYAFKNYFK